MKKEYDLLKSVFRPGLSRSLKNKLEETRGKRRENPYFPNNLGQHHCPRVFFLEFLKDSLHPGPLLRSFHHVFTTPKVTELEGMRERAAEAEKMWPGWGFEVALLSGFDRFSMVFSVAFDSLPQGFTPQNCQIPVSTEGKVKRHGKSWLIAFRAFLAVG